MGLGFRDIVGSWVIGSISLYRDPRTGTQYIGNWASRSLGFSVSGLGVYVGSSCGHLGLIDGTSGGGGGSRGLRLRVFRAS